jgi:mitogen-activated protein kinase kinase kinase
MQKQQQALASRNVIKAGVSAPSPAIEKRSASPRSAISRRPRQTSKDIPSAIDEGNSRPGSRGGSASGKTAPAADASTSSANPDSEKGNPMNRRASFSNNAWLYRPPVEQVYDNLEEYFPGHDLDKPIVDAGISGPGSAVSSPALDSAGPSPAMPRFDPTSPIHEEPELMQPQQPAKESKPEKELFRRFNSNRKSIRMVAQDRKSKLKKEESAARSLIMGAKDEIKEKLARRKSTKVWGRKIEEVTSAEAEALSSAKEPVSADKEERKSGLPLPRPAL